MRLKRTAVWPTGKDLVTGETTVRDETTATAEHHDLADLHAQSKFRARIEPLLTADQAP
jgi:hypothetical protein